MGTAKAEALRAFDQSAKQLQALRESHEGGLRRRKFGAPGAQEFRSAMKLALPAVALRFGRLMDAHSKVRTEPEDERLMREAAKVLAALHAEDRTSDLFAEMAAVSVLAFFVGERREALRWANEAGKVDPREPHNKLNGAVLATEFFNFDLALRLANDVLLAAPDTKFAWVAKADALLGARRAGEHKATQLERSGDKEGARALRKQSEELAQDARSALREVVRIDPKDALAWYDLGKFLYTRSELLEAKAAYGHAVEIDPKMKLAWYQKGSVHEALEEPDDAIAAIERGLALDERDVSTHHFRLAAMHALKGNKEKAFEWIRSGLALNRTNFYSEIYRVEFGVLADDPRWEDLLAAFFKETGFRHTKAAQADLGFSWGLFDYGSVLFFDSLADAFGAAEAFRRDGENAKARQYYEKLLELLTKHRHPLKAKIVRARLDGLPA